MSAFFFPLPTQRTANKTSVIKILIVDDGKPELISIAFPDTVSKEIKNVVNIAIIGLFHAIPAAKNPRYPKLLPVVVRNPAFNTTDQDSTSQSCKCSGT